MARLSPFGLLRRLGPQRFIQIVYHLPNFLRLFSRLIRDPRVSLWPKMLVVVILAYVLAPLDLLPDFMPGLGQIDDLIVIFLGLQLFLRLCPKEVVSEHVRAIANGR